MPKMSDENWNKVILLDDTRSDEVKFAQCRSEEDFLPEFTLSTMSV